MYKTNQLTIPLGSQGCLFAYTRIHCSGRTPCKKNDKSSTATAYFCRSVWHCSCYGVSLTNPQSGSPVGEQLLRYCEVDGLNHCDGMYLTFICKYLVAIFLYISSREGKYHQVKTVCLRRFTSLEKHVKPATGIGPG